MQNCVEILFRGVFPQKGKSVCFGNLWLCTSTKLVFQCPKPPPPPPDSDDHQDVLVVCYRMKPAPHTWGGYGKIWIELRSYAGKYATLDICGM